MNAPAPISTPRPAPGLDTLMARVESLRALSRTRSTQRSAPPAFAAQGREIAPGLYLAQRRYPLCYLKIVGAALSLCSPLPFPSQPESQNPALLSLCPALLDDGSSRLFLAGVARVDEGQFLVRQVFAATPGAEAALVAWLETELAESKAVLCSDSRGKTLLLEARLRQGRNDLLPWTWSAVKSPAVRRPRSAAPSTWRKLREEADTAAQSLSQNRAALLALAKEQRLEAGGWGLGAARLLAAEIPCQQLDCQAQSG